MQLESGERLMTKIKIAEVSNIICEEINRFEYGRVCQRAHNKEEMIFLYKFD